ncbi:MAG: Prolyl tripeptidyl peptidase precursor [Bacteroidetes bacterium ADurb.Bin037]|nr:MAG: Prolyl tripeptidyl peptidase precursor [Bacteroidetes bacterium ADurb.Bin037]HPW78172.1 S9 family peptidase [Bacteroidales bacterium]HQB56597.1 S9 family peptidase [Bacteroidales bacterium]
MNRIICILMMLTSSLALNNCNKNADSKAPLIGKNTDKLENDLLNPIVLNHLGRLSDPQVSPDGKRIVYGVTYTSIEEDKRNRELFVMDIDGSNNCRITSTNTSESNARWLDNDRILFLCQGKLWVMQADGTDRRQITGTERPIDEFSLSPDGGRLLFISRIKASTKPTDIDPALNKASGRVIDDLMYRHWDCFVEDIPHSFVASFDGESLSSETDLLEGQPFELPTLPFGDIGELCWSPDGKSIAYSCRKLTGVDYAVSTNTDIYLKDLETGKEVNLSQGMMGYDTAPRFSPCGKFLVWNSMEREGYEADKNRLMFHSFEDGTTRDLTADFRYNVESVTWMKDSKGLYFTSCAEGITHVFVMDLASGQIRRITNGWYNCGPVQLAGSPAEGETLIGTFVSMSMPTELVSIDPVSGEYTQLSFENSHLLDQLTMGRVEERWITTTDNKKMLTWIVYPPHFDPQKKYPAVLFCAGGPQSTLSQGWSYRWCHQLIAANGYIVILPNRRGTTAFGQEWTEQISGDYAGQNMRDYLSAVDHMKREPYVDGNRIAAVGASYGGYSVFYLAGTHSDRFAAFIAHAGIFNTEHMYMTTEEIWFPHWDNGGAPWDKNPVAVRHYAQSPHKRVQHWNKPILITHGELDYRVPVDQAMAAYNAALLNGVPARLVLFPDENHWILKAQNNILWNRIFFEFLDKYLK